MAGEAQSYTVEQLETWLRNAVLDAYLPPEVKTVGGFRALVTLAIEGLRARDLAAAPPDWKERLVDLILARKHGASGMAVFVDPVIVRGLIEDALAGKTARVDKRGEQPR